jgi:hypothetical protein
MDCKNNALLNNASVKNPFKAWLSELLLSREYFKGPSGKPLYSYQISEFEYESLRDLLKQNTALFGSTVYAGYVAACWCLFVSEQYRRNYNSSWSWSGAEGELGVELTPAQHANFTQKGLEYWGRPILHRSNGRDWLGSLFIEGGLPWPLVKSDSHGFGRAVRGGIKNYYKTEGSRYTTADLIAEYERYLPITFRNLETRQLLAGIVDQLMYLVEQYPIRDQQDPAGYLDKTIPEWTQAFPIPLDESNARGLINDWLRDAGEKRQARKEILERSRAFTCEHFLREVLPEWDILTEIILPSEEILKIDAENLSGTRLELAYYEGERLLARGAAVYGEFVNGGLKVRFINTQVSLNRRNLTEPVNLHFLDSGRTVHCIYFDGSNLDYQEMPLVFESRDDRWRLLGTSSCKLSGSTVKLRIPKGFIASSDKGDIKPIAEDVEGGQWLESLHDLTIRSGQEYFRIELNQEKSDENRPSLVGSLAVYESNPSAVFLGWPTLTLPEGYEYNKEDLQEFANGRLLDTSGRTNIYGHVRYVLKNNSGKTILQRRFAVLPREFGFSLIPAVKELPAKLYLRGASKLDVSVDCDVVRIEKVMSDQGSAFHMSHSGDIPPASFRIKVSDVSGQHSVWLKLPYPYKGARLLDESGNTSQGRDLILYELLGHRIVLSSGLPQGESFYMQLELICQEQPHPKRSYEIKVGTYPVQLNLYSYQSDILQMLGAVDDQDAFIKLTMEADNRLLSLNIRRYNGVLEWDGHDVFFIHGMASSSISDGAEIEVMLISDPKKEPLPIGARNSQGIGAGIFDVPQAMRRRGPWLIYPVKNCKIQFRPVLYVPDGFDVDFSGEVNSLQKASEVYHPKKNPNALKFQIEAMANDFRHSGWQYLADLKQYYSHLPLSSFESWRALSKHSKALAFAVFRLEFDEEFCSRIRDELAIIWEVIPMSVWVEAYQYFMNSLTETGLPEALVNNLIRNRSAVLRFVVSGFDYIGDYLVAANKNALKFPPPDIVLPIWYQTLRQQHEANNRWPIDLRDPLNKWIEKQNLPPLVKSLSLVEYSDAVVYLPIFMAFVTSGKAKITDLSVPAAYLKFAIRLVSDFDRQGWFAPVHALMVSYFLAAE